MGKGVAREGLLWPKLREYWHPVAFAEDADDGPLAVTLLDERVAVCRIGGQVRAFRDLCVHRGTPISLGWVEDDTLVCGLSRLGLPGGRPVRPDSFRAAQASHPEEGLLDVLSRRRAVRPPLGLPGR